MGDWQFWKTSSFDFSLFAGVWHEMIEGVVYGALAGITAKTVIAPAERIKMSFQVSNERFSYHSAYLRGKKFISSGGFLSLWRGHSTTILRVAPYAGFSYAFHDVAEKVFKRMAGDPLPFSYKFLAGSIGGISGTLLTYPLDVLRVRLALIPGSTFRSLIRQGGLYHGLLPTLLGIIPYAGTTWSVKQILQELYFDMTGNKLMGGSLLIANIIAGLSGQLVTYPLDIIRRRMQMAINDPLMKHHVTIRYFFEFICIYLKKIVHRCILKNLIEKEGYRALTKGFSINIIKGPITLGISLTTYDFLKHFLHINLEAPSVL